MKRLTVSAALATLDAAESDYADLFQHGTLRVGLYRPEGEDQQTPHRQDEVYVVLTGRGDFVCDGRRQPFEPGEILFVPAHTEHRFENFSKDFSTWVFFYGADGGEPE